MSQTMAELMWSSAILHADEVETKEFKAFLKISLIGNFLLLLSAGDPDPQDPHVFGPHGSGYSSQKYGSGFFPFSQ
jgi:hypothetical protein